MQTYIESAPRLSVSVFWTNLLMSLVVAFGAGSVGVGFSSHIPTGLYDGMVALEFVLILTIQLMRKKKSMSYAMCYAFVLLSGFVAGVAIGSKPAYVNEVGISAVETLIIFAILAAIAIRTKTLFLRWGQSLFAMLISLVIVELLGIFVFGLTSVAWMVLSAVGVLIFSGYILYDIQRAYNRGYAVSIPLLVVSVYLDILNLFMNLLNLNVGSKRS